MNRLKGWKIRNMVLLIMLAMVLPLSLLSSALDFHLYKRNELRHIDAQLFNAAVLAKATLPDNYHDAILDAATVTPEAFDRIVDRNNKLCEELGLEYLWSLMLLDGRLCFTSATSPDKKVENHQHAKFLEPHANPELYAHAFQTMEPQFQNNIDKWGSIRAVLVPFYDSQGRKCLFGASKKLSDIHANTATLLRNALFALLILLIPGILVSLIFSKWLTSPIARLADAAEEIGEGRYETDINIEGSREVNVLAHQLADMRDAIRDQMASLAKAMDELRNFEQIVNSSPIIVYRLRYAPKEWPVEFVSNNINQLGYSAAQLLSGQSPWYCINYPEDIPAVEKFVKEVIDQGEDAFNLESRMLTATGEIRWMHSWNRFIRDGKGNITHLHGIFVDITDRKISQERDGQYRQRLKALSQDLATTEDRERRQFAEALHEDVGQMLAGLNMKFTALKEAVDRDRIDDLFEQVDTLLQHIMGKCKSLTWTMCPPSLYETDIAAGLERMAEDLKDLFGIDVSIQTAGLRIELDREASAFIFRWAKELLVNVAKHAETTAADIAVSQYTDKIYMVVTDQGKGMDTSELENGSGTGFGLFSIRENLAQMGGLMNIQSEPGKGTKVLIICPLPSLLLKIQ
ncbi:PAS domain-containing protein [Pontiella sulfatireligans]|uniref:Oxygen sensor histidine kinase NreB n=1 Tax=Pontiella sulfatireligans TaxID=2750658 RepID=A0A6C2ULD9_9BACT|nr:PAS domain-containing protein [Pontiella sulfatireligans]VGO20006.1 Oxygen sensor histidine kinase NreB [Pontiella sulfatireligans]